MDPNYKEEEEGAGSSSTGQSTGSGAVKLDANKTKENPKKKGCC